jgi:hypothetical protein
VNDCYCPQSVNLTKEAVSKLYKRNIPFIEEVIPGYNVNENVYAIKTGTNYYSKATVIGINPDNSSLYDIQFEDGTIMDNVNFNVILKYFSCVC